MASKAQPRVVRSLAVIVLALVALYSLIAIKGWSPKLGLDLRGGTSVTLTSRGPSPRKGQLSKAVDIIRQRVNGLGVGESEVTAEGSRNIVIAVPNAGRSDVLRLVGKTAKLRFRPVLSTVAPGPIVASPAPTAPNSTTATIKPTGRATQSPRKRPVSAALVQPQAASPTPTGSAVTAATPSASATPFDQAALQKRFQDLDCSQPDERAEAAGDDNPDFPIVSCERDGSAKYLLDKSVQEGTDVKNAIATVDAGQASTGEWEVDLEFTDKGARRFADVTKQNVNKQVAIVLDGVVQSAPNINEPITGGRAQITGNFTKKSATELANVLKYGALPLAFDTSQTETISPTLGKKSLHAGVLAGMLGLAVVIVYTLAYYRGLGLVTVLGLAIFTALDYALVVVLGEMIGFTLSLAGIAGLIVSVGITADSYVVFYERLKDEVREGRTLRSGADRGWARAFRTILAADVVSFLAAATLYVLSIGAVRGFAFTLGLSTLLDVAIAYLFTRPTVLALTRTKLFSEGRFVGIKAAIPVAAGVPATRPREA
ncbi:MAG: protein translocase subunit SecD [Mycobacteriales bacterium]|nr:protein translocase subunit SecD [Frankia sp.]